jgi:hypothetical protein
MLLAMLLAGCSAHKVGDIKAHASEAWHQAGFEIIGYEGYQYGTLGEFGGCVWYTVRRVPDNGITYEGCLAKWGDEYHVYSLTALDAIKPKN